MNNDLISRSALKEQISELHSHDDSIDIWLKREDVDNLIDNAPTVDLTKNQAYDKGFITAMKLYARPQGEWKVYGKQGGIPITDMCSNCRYEMKWYKNKYKFCPNCGASMRKGGAE